tara:strand:- start:3202 stop:3864 length:663 start_codon:yes stop_codon:yes gene_type:complete
MEDETFRQLYNRKNMILYNLTLNRYSSYDYIQQKYNIINKYNYNKSYDNYNDFITTFNKMNKLLYIFDHFIDTFYLIQIIYNNNKGVSYKPEDFFIELDSQSYLWSNYGKNISYDKTSIHFYIDCHIKITLFFVDTTNIHNIDYIIQKNTYNRQILLEQIKLYKQKIKLHQIFLNKWNNHRIHILNIQLHYIQYRIKSFHKKMNILLHIFYKYIYTIFYK